MHAFFNGLFKWRFFSWTNLQVFLMEIWQHYFCFILFKCGSSLFTFISKGFVVCILVHVEDIIITRSSTALLTAISTKLHNFFAFTQLGTLDYFMRVQVKSQTDNSLFLCQSNISVTCCTKQIWMKLAWFILQWHLQLSSLRSFP